MLLPGFLDVASDVPLAAGAPSLWAAAAMLPWVGGLPLTGLAAAAALGVAATLLAFFAAHPPRRGRAWPAALLAALAMPMLLPAMSLAYFIPAGLLAIVDAWQRHDDGVARWVFAGILAAAIGLPALGAAAIGMAIRRSARVAIVLPANDNALPLGPPSRYRPVPVG